MTVDDYTQKIVDTFMLTGTETRSWSETKVDIRRIVQRAYDEGQNTMRLRCLDQARLSTSQVQVVAKLKILVPVQ